MKVLVNAISARKGGIVTYTNNLARALADRGVELVLAVPEDFPKVDGVRLLHTDAPRYRPARRLIWEQTLWRRIVAAERPDVLFSSANFGLLASPVPQVLLLREGGLFDPFYLINMAPDQGVLTAFQRMLRRRMMLMSAARATTVMTPTRAMKDLLAQWMSGLDGRCVVNAYGTLVDVFTPPAAPRPAWTPDRPLELLYVSVYYPHKVPGQIIETLDELKAIGIEARATITMDPEEPLEMKGGAFDKAMFDRALADDRVTLGRRAYTDLPELYAAHDLFVFPSVSETFGHPMAEAMSAGLPIVAADTPVNREICGDAALYHRPLSRRSMAEKIAALARDPAAMTAKSKEGRTRAVERFTWGAHVDNLMDVFEATARKGGGR